MSSPYSSHNWKRPSRRSFLSKNTLKNVFLVILLIGVAGTLCLLTVFAYVSRDLPDPNAITQRTIKQSTKIYDRTGTHLLYEIFGDQNRTLVKVQHGFCGEDSDLPTDPSGIPLFAVQATIAAEDEAFCTHHGFSVKGVLRAVLFGGSRGGGSTLTQQLVKNAILSNERTLTRKVKELILSIELERRYSKDEILQIYFNEIPYGSTYYGIQAAAQSFYGKPVNELNLPEAATIAAIPQVPTYYINNPDQLKIRRDWILDRMAEQKFITTDEATAAKDVDTPVKSRVSKITAPHFVFYVKQLLEEEFGQRQVEEGGLKVITSLDFDLQKIAEDSVTEGVEARSKQYKFNNASLVAMDPKTGQILAMVGSKDYFGKSEPEGCVSGKTCTFEPNANVALRNRQPGSSFKPIVYSDAFTLGYTPNTILWDVKTVFPTPTTPYVPNNYDGKENGPIRVRDSLQRSLNIPAVEMMYLVGVETVLTYAEALGYTTFKDRSRFGLAVVLGGGEVKLLEHTSAYGTLSNDGVRQNVSPILKVTDPNNVTLKEWVPKDGSQVLDPNAARMITDVLSDNTARSYVFGPNSFLQLGPIPSAAKSGTTNNNIDAWTMGYVPSLVAGVWVGNNDNSQMSAKADGSVVAAPIWNAFMKKALEGKPVEAFVKPEIPITGKPVLDGTLPGTHVVVDRASGNLATEYTPLSYRETRLYAEYHSILHYVDRADPLGPPPAVPADDPYYQPWEDAVADWIRRQEETTGVHISNQLPPVDYDNLHVPANLPTVTAFSPAQGSTITGRTVEMTVDATAPRGIRYVDFYLDGQWLGTDSQPPYSLSAPLPSAVLAGVHTLKAIAYDDIDNAGSTTVNIHVEGGAIGAVLDIVDPKQGQTIERAVPTYTVTVSLDSPKQYASVTVFVRKSDGTGRQVVGSKSLPDSPFIQIPWTIPADGGWILSAEASPKPGYPALQTAGVMVRVTPVGGESPPQTLSPFLNSATNP